MLPDQHIGLSTSTGQQKLLERYPFGFNTFSFRIFKAYFNLFSSCHTFKNYHDRIISSFYVAKWLMLFRLGFCFFFNLEMISKLRKVLTVTIVLSIPCTHVHLLPIFYSTCFLSLSHTHTQKPSNFFSETLESGSRISLMAL